MRNYDQLVSDIIYAMPSKAEIEALSDEQIQTLRKHGNCYDNMLYLATAEGRALVAEARQRRADVG